MFTRITPQMDNASVKPSPRLFWLLTAGYILIAIAASVSNWKGMVGMAPNEWGDVFAGVFSPLAFLWFLYTALAQRAELRLQHEELRNNTRAQDAQEGQMQRQADALDAQVARLRAQSDAQYQPIWVMLTSGAGRPGCTQVRVKNYGCAVLDVKILNHGRIVRLESLADVRGEVLSHWPAGASTLMELEAQGQATEGDAEDRVFEIQFTRLDLAMYVYRYRYKNNEQRLVLEQVRETSEPPPG